MPLSNRNGSDSMEAHYSDWATVAIFFALVLGLGIPLGSYIARVYSAKPTWLDFMAPAENGLLRISGINLRQELSWKQNLTALLGLNALFFIWAIALLMGQGRLPLNPDGIASMEPTLAFNTAISFMTNTNLQHYSGETGLSYGSQIWVICFLQFVSAASGMAMLAVLFKAVTRSESELTGNFYSFFLLSATRILLPLALVMAVCLLAMGTPATLVGAAHFVSLQGDSVSVARGPIAAIVAIKQLGTNGGGYFGTNSTHPFENPSFLTNLLENWAIMVLPVAMVFAFGAFTNLRREARVIFWVMLAGLVLLLTVTLWQETAGNPVFTNYSIAQPSGAMEGKEQRIGPAASALWAAVTTATSNGSVNSMHDSLMPLTGMTAMLGMMVNAFFGGVGVGFLNFYIFLILAVFIAGLMVGRTPELFGKKIEAREVKIAALVFLLHPLLILGSTAFAVFTYVKDPAAHAAWLANPGFHGFSEILYEYTSSAANNGSGFEGLGDNNPFWNATTGLVMLIARFVPIIGPVAIAGMLAEKRRVPEGAGTLKTSSFTFGLVLFSVIAILSALAFFPALILGPVAEHFTR